MGRSSFYGKLRRSASFAICNGMPQQSGTPGSFRYLPCRGGEKKGYVACERGLLCGGEGGKHVAAEVDRPLPGSRGGIAQIAIDEAGAVLGIENPADGTE